MKAKNEIGDVVNLGGQSQVIDSAVPSRGLPASSDGRNSQQSSARQTPSQTTVLVGFAEALAAPESVWSLVDAGFHVVAFARKGRKSALRHSKHVECHEICAPETDLQAALSDLRNLVNSFAAPTDGSRLILFPFDDKAVWLCSKIELNDHWLLAGPSGACADLALDKSLQLKAAAAAGFNVLDWALIRTAKELFESPAAQWFPIILKAVDCVPVSGGRFRSSRKWICANRAELERAAAEWGERTPLIAQKFITGVGEGAFGLATPSGVRAWSGHHRVRMMNPQGSGSSACASQAVPADLRAVTEKFLQKAGWRGLFMIELLRDDAGKLWFVEINGRPWGSMALCRRQGLEYPAWHVALTMDEESPAGQDAASNAAIVCRHAGREFMHLLFVLRGAKSNALKKFPSFWQSFRDVLRFGRGDGLYNWRRDDPKVFMADFYYTIHDNIFKSRS